MRFNIKRCIKYKGRGCFFIDKMGFTLIELIIVLSIISLITAAVFVSVDPARRLGEAKDAKRFSDLIAIAKAVELYSADNGALPIDFEVDNISSIKKIVLCSSAGSLTCDGQTRDCLVVDDSNFIGKYLHDLPIDPNKSVTGDTGYYVTRGQGDSIVFGACGYYDDNASEIISAMSMPDLVTVCGDGDVEGDEVCDDSNLVTESCGNGILESSGTYCNSDCTAEVVIASSEVCDYNVWTEDCQSALTPGLWYTENDVATKYCSIDCLEKYIFECVG